LNWPTLGRREAHPRPFRAGQNAPTGAHGDRGRFPTDKDSRAYGGSYAQVVRLPLVPFQHNLKKALAPLRLEGVEAILLPQETEVCLEFFTFDGAYVERLRAGDPSTEQHFVAYFEQLLRIKLRSRMLPSDKVEDLRQETFIRVIANLRRDGGVRQPERFGAFVNSICNHVLQEFYRSSAKNQPMEETHMDIPDKVLDLEGMLVTKQSAEQVRRILDAMPKRDRELLRAIFLEEKEKDTVCQELGVDREYLRVLVYRAKDKFKALYEKGQMGVARRATGLGNQ
jgi:RNA polymerase sigma-70 factor (ECF subfamily)